ncbi:MAG: hypothetical protein NC041_07045 [Bacteroides sp.]|nr:hypothetical protein [Prevotella sp.]MCM1407053.1 hypothetical protein [Treponema brennaborense]MCM1470205.1 hypothetical protein [Bacteroides sp.]
MLTFPLKKEQYENICCGGMLIDYREVKPYWSVQIENELGLGKAVDELQKKNGVLIPFQKPCILRLGLTKKCTTAQINQIAVLDGKDTDLKIDKLVYAFHIEKATTFSPEETNVSACASASVDNINRPEHYTREGAMECIDEMMLVFGAMR